MFWSSTGGVAKDSNDYIQYDAATKTLFYDADGSDPGAPVAFAVLVGFAGTLNSANFMVIAPPGP
jgi:hypothetical protein